jgi:hypothetical protein
MTQMMDRRLFLGGIAAGAVVGLSAPGELLAAPLASFVMWHNPGCGCCLEWAKRMEATFRRKLPIVETSDLAAVKRARGVPADLQSCHTALVGGYSIEGHVPPADIQRLIASKNRQIRGLAVPGMPMGSPGMDVGHNQKQPYRVFAFASNGRRSVFATHG